MVTYFNRKERSKHREGHVAAKVHGQTYCQRNYVTAARRVICSSARHTRDRFSFVGTFGGHDILEAIVFDTVNSVFD